MELTAPPMAVPSDPSPAPPRDRIDLATFLATHEAACPVCGYNLRGLLADRCPECGRHLVLAVGTTEPKLGAFIAGLIGLAAGLGFCTLLFAYAMIFVYSRGGGGPSQFSILILAAGIVLCGVGTVGWLLMRRRLAPASDIARWAWAGACCAIGLSCPILFILTVR